MIDGVNGASSTASVFNAPGIRPADPATQQGQQPQASQGLRPGQEQQQPTDVRQALNTAPTSAQRDEALANGQTRGSFVNIQA